MELSKIQIIYQPKITEDQLWDFYVRNDICEVGHGRETAVIPLSYPSVMVGAFYEDKLVGIVRTLFDGLSASIAEFCLECELQGDELKYENGSLIEKDDFGIGKKMGMLLFTELKKAGNTFTSVYIVENCEEEFYSSINLSENVGHKVYYQDERSYVD